MQPLAFFIFAENYRCENGWSTTPRFISFPLRAFGSMIFWRKRPERKDEVHEFPVWNVHEAHGRSTAVGRNAPSRTQTIILQVIYSLVSPQVQNWTCWYSPSIQSRSSLAVLCHCSFTQPNTCGHSPFLMETSSWMARLCQELPAYFARAEGVSFEPRVHKNKSMQLSVVLLWMLSRQNSKFVITANVNLY